ncbi:MAG: hypothetical protein M3Y74_14215, partial [Chloroflexota bacterium]|nr:hypothetical protein [Chloroflexota bacterium]
MTVVTLLTAADAAHRGSRQPLHVQVLDAYRVMILDQARRQFVAEVVPFRRDLLMDARHPPPGFR